jgi:hypothetical protein
MRFSTAFGVVLGGLYALAGRADGQQTPRASTPQDTLLPAMRCQAGDGSGRCTLWAPSLIELIVRPELYDRKRVVVSGFISFEFEGNALYLSANDWEHGILANSLVIEPPPGFESDTAPARKAVNRRYVIVEGTFDAGKRSHLGMVSGGIGHITRLGPLPNPPGR